MTALGFTFAGEHDPDLPRMAWCARVRRGSSVVRVRAGRDVELAENAVVEGAWDGAFAGRDFDRACSLAGTGARVRDGVLRFLPGSGRHDRLYAVARADDLVVSNSLVFALVAADDEPDPRRPRLVRGLLDQVAHGTFEHTIERLPARRHEVRFFELRDFTVGPDLGIAFASKAAPPAPAGFAGIVELLEGVIERTFANAADPARRRQYTPLSTISRGYDSPVAALLAGRKGCRQTLTFGETAPGVPSDDDGSEIGRLLGLEVLRRPRDAWRGRTDLPEAEIWACPPGLSLPMASVEPDLAGRVLVTGRFGDRIFTLAGDYQGETVPTLSILTAPSVLELRLRVGFVHFGPFFACRAHIAMMQALSRSEAMAPWRVDNAYDRPIARRILEEAGVPREAFGRDKLAGGVIDARDPYDLTPTSQRDFAAFLAERPDVPRGRDLPARRAANRVLKRARRAAAPMLRRLGLPVPPRLGAWPRQHDDRLFHWAFARVRPRYAGRAP